MQRTSGSWIWCQKGIQAVMLFSVTLWLVPSLDAAEGKRVAFVVGIGTYDNLADDKQLKNAVNDAEGVSAKLTAIGFQVTKAPNLTRSVFNTKWQNVLDSLSKDDTFVLYYSGHGVQIDGHNYLLPRDIPYIEYGRDEQLKREAISLNELLADLSTGDRPHPKSSVVILDACRDNPLIPPGYKSTSTARGLAGLPESEGIFVLYAAASNRTALDRLSASDNAKYSVFTRTLLPLMGRTDLSIQELSSELKDQVWKLAKSAGREQRPTYYDGIVGRFCLPGCTVKDEKGPEGVVVSGVGASVAGSTGTDSGGAKTSAVGTGLPKEITGKDGAPMVLVPAGEFMMGSREDDRSASNDERPAHSVYLDGYYIDQYEVTTARYAKFFQETNRSAPDYWSEQVLKRHRNKPVVGVNWNDAAAYCSWAGKRLPTEAEWEKAARGTDQQLYPWGNSSSSEQRANFDHCCDFKDYGALTDVGSFEQGKSPYGTYDMAGNVWEWVADWYGETYYGWSPERNPKGPSTRGYRVLRGGSWGDVPVMGRSATRSKTIPSLWDSSFGFRCAQDIPK